MTEVLSLWFDESLSTKESEKPSQQLDAHLVTLAGVAGTLATALSASKDESLSECAYFLELEIQRLRELLSRCTLCPSDSDGEMEK